MSRECFRFCVLTPTTFSYYNSDDTSKYDNLKGAFDLASVEFGLGWDLNRKSPTPHIFHLKKPERTYYFAAESPQELADWEDHLRYVLQLDDFDEFEWDESDEEELGDLEGLPPPPPTRNDRERFRGAAPPPPEFLPRPPAPPGSGNGNGAANTGTAPPPPPTTRTAGDPPAPPPGPPPGAKPANGAMPPPPPPLSQRGGPPAPPADSANPSSSENNDEEDITFYVVTTEGRFDMLLQRRKMKRMTVHRMKKTLSAHVSGMDLDDMVRGGALIGWPNCGVLIMGRFLQELLLNGKPLSDDLTAEDLKLENGMELKLEKKADLRQSGFSSRLPMVEEGDEEDEPRSSPSEAEREPPGPPAIKETKQFNSAVSGTVEGSAPQPQPPTSSSSAASNKPFPTISGSSGTAAAAAPPSVASAVEDMGLDSTTKDRVDRKMKLRRLYEGIPKAVGTGVIDSKAVRSDVVTALEKDTDFMSWSGSSSMLNRLKQGDSDDWIDWTQIVSELYQSYDEADDEIAGGTESKESAAPREVSHAAASSIGKGSEDAPAPRAEERPRQQPAAIPPPAQPSTTGQAAVVMTVEVRGGASDQITVRPGDDPDRLALEFIRKHDVSLHGSTSS